MEGVRNPFVKLYASVFHVSESILPRPVAILNLSGGKVAVVVEVLVVVVVVLEI